MPHSCSAARCAVAGSSRTGRGFRRGALYEGRDLKPTLDLRAVMKGVLAEHLQVASGALDGQVFPESASVRALTDLRA